MKAKLIYALVLLALVFASADATQRAPKEGISLQYQEEDNGDFTLYLFPHGKLLVCEEQPIKLIEPDDPTHEPLILRCKHK